MHCSPSTEGRPLVFVAAGCNQIVLLNLETGLQRYSFAALHGDPTPEELVPLAAPFHAVDVNEVGIEAFDLASTLDAEPSVRAILCPCDVLSGARGIGSPPTVITAGTDATIRLWDVNEARRGSYVVSGPADAPISRWTTREVVQQAEKFGSGHLFLCRPSASAAATTPKKKMVGPASPAHMDAVLDLESARIVPLEGGPATNCLVSAGRDCVVKVWR